jgi:hypothetical protein
MPATLTKVAERLRALRGYGMLNPPPDAAPAKRTKRDGNLRKNGEQSHESIAWLDNPAPGTRQGNGTPGKRPTDTSLADEAEKILTRTSQAMSELRGVVTNLDAAVAMMQKIPVRTDANDVKDLPSLIGQMQASMSELGRLIEALQQHWLLRKYVNKSKPPPARPLPAGGGPARKPFKPLRPPKDLR